MYICFELAAYLNVQRSSSLYHYHLALTRLRCAALLIREKGNEVSSLPSEMTDWDCNYSRRFPNSYEYQMDMTVDEIINKLLELSFSLNETFVRRLAIRRSPNHDNYYRDPFHILYCTYFTIYCCYDPTFRAASRSSAPCVWYGMRRKSHVDQSSFHSTVCCLRDSSQTIRLSDLIGCGLVGSGIVWRDRQPSLMRCVVSCPSRSPEGVETKKKETLCKFSFHYQQ